MATFTLTLKCDNAAFTETYPRHEIARILTKLASDLRDGKVDDQGKLRDTNGNTVGEYAYRA
jgi:hypothetical protein